MALLQVKQPNLKKNVKKEPDTSQDTPLMMCFREYSRKLDDKNDKYERIYKANRDVTQKSKRVIFALQRIAGLSNEERDQIISNASHDLKNIEQTLIKHIAMELRNEEQYQYHHAYTGGIEEYIEAVTFLEFLKNDRLVSRPFIQNKVTYGEGEETDVVPLSVYIPPLNYMLGLTDLTGELMRYCIKNESFGNYDICLNICFILQELYGKFVSLGYLHSKELHHKMSTLQSSVKKVEDVCYSFQLRRVELPDASFSCYSPTVVLDE